MMKRLFAGAIAALLSAVSIAATTTPVQLISPSGSTAGQAIVSTGASSAPAWGSVTATALAAQAANTVVANVTGSSASPTAFPMPSCSAANSAVQYASGVGYQCGTSFALTTGTLAQFAATTSAQLAVVISDETGSGALVFGTSPTLTTPNVVGTATNNNAAAGSVGEFPTPSNLSGVSLTTGIPTNVSSIVLTAGDWDVQAVVQYVPAGSTVIASVIASVSTTSGSTGGFPNTAATGFSGAAGLGQQIASPVVRISVASTTTVYAVANAAFTVSTCTANGSLRARRVR